VFAQQSNPHMLQCEPLLRSALVSRINISSRLLKNSFSTASTHSGHSISRVPAPNGTNCLTDHLDFTTGGGTQVPSPGGRIDGCVSFGQYIRIIRTKSPSGAGSQFASLSLPGDSCWK
jgi:hypothetical protein